MIHGVHGNTTSLGPRVALDSELVLGARSLEQRLVGTATTGDDTNHTTGGVLDDLLGTGGQLDTGLAILGVVANDGHVVTGGTAQSTTVTGLLLDVGDDGTLGNGSQGENVADGQGSVLAGVDELAGVHALVGDEGLGDGLELVGVSELDLGERSTTTSVVDVLVLNAPVVAMALSEVEGTELSRGLVQAGVGRCRAKIRISNSRSEQNILIFPSLSSSCSCFFLFLLLLFVLLFLHAFRLAQDELRSHSLKMEPRPFLWLRITRPMATVYMKTLGLVC